MDPLIAGVWAIALGLISLAGVWFIKTPKESHAELATRVSAIEVSTQNLAVQFAGMNGKLGTQINALSDNIKELASNVRELTRRMDSHRVGG